MSSVLGAAAAAPEIPALAALLAALASFLGFVVATGLLLVWRRSLGKFCVYIADQLDKASVSILGRTFHLLGPVSSALRSANRTVDHYLGEAVLWSGRGAATLFSFFISINLWMAREIADLARDTWSAIRGIETISVTRVTKVVQQTIVRPLTAKVVAGAKISTAQWRALVKREHALELRVARIARAIPVALPSPFPRIRGLERRAESQAKRLSRLEKGALAGITAAVTLAALKRLGLGWTRCSNVAKAGKAICGMDSTLLDVLLGSAVLVGGSVGLRDLALGLQGVADEANGAVLGFIRET